MNLLYMRSFTMIVQKTMFLDQVYPFGVKLLIHSFFPANMTSQCQMRSGLLRCLMTGTNAWVEMVDQLSTPLTPVRVSFGLGLIKMELQEKDNMLAMSTWARYVSPISDC